MNKCSNCEKLEKKIEELTTLTLDDLKKIDDGAVEKTKQYYQEIIDERDFTIRQLKIRDCFLVETFNKIASLRNDYKKMTKNKFINKLDEILHEVLNETRI